MSVQAMAWAMSQTLTTHPPSRHVLLILANYAGQDGQAAFPSVATLAGHTGLAERTIQNCLKKLEACGAIARGNQGIAAVHIDRADRRPVVYDLPLHRGAGNAVRNARGESDNRTGRISRQNGAHLTNERGAGDAPKPSYKPSYKPSNKPYAGGAKKQTQKYFPDNGPRDYSEGVNPDGSF
jgi:hypothetical protein